MVCVASQGRYCTAKDCYKCCASSAQTITKGLQLSVTKGLTVKLQLPGLCHVIFLALVMHKLVTLGGAADLWRCRGLQSTY